jgi:signal peptidase I
VTLFSLARRAVVLLAVLMCVGGLGSVLAVSLANRGGYQALGMKTGSMRPTINPGDLVLAERVRPADIRAGDVISFREPIGSQAPYTHRVVRVVDGADGPEFTTKGDANPTADMWTVRYAAAGWRVVHVVRHGGRFLAFVQSAAVHRLIAVAVSIVTIALLWPVLVEPRRTPVPLHPKEVKA